jgi:hypothetical protein
LRAGLLDADEVGIDRLEEDSFARLVRGERPAGAVRVAVVEGTAHAGSLHAWKPGQAAPVA